MSFPITAQRRSTTSMYRWQQLTNGSKPTTCYPTKIATRPIQNICFFDEYETTEAERHRKHSEWQLHSHCRKEMESHTPRQATPENRIGTILGVTSTSPTVRSPQRARSGRATSVTTDGEDARTAVETSKTATYAGTRKCAGWAQA